MIDVNEILNVMKQIKYGYLDDDGTNICESDSKSIFYHKYRLMTPEELLNKKIGACWDQVELERKLFDDKSIKNNTYFIYLDDSENLPSHTFLVFYESDKVYWFRHPWNDDEIREYKTLNDLLNDVEREFMESHGVSDNSNIHIYEYSKPKFNISCEEFYNYIFTQKEIFNYQIKNASIKDLDRIKKYKLNSIIQYAGYLPEEEMNRINNYVNDNTPKEIEEYKNIICKGKIVGSYLVTNIDGGYLIDEIYLDEYYRGKGIGSSIIYSIIQNADSDIYLWVYKANKVVHLYQKLGFKIKEETDSRYYMEYKK